jgi:hypothetical protein
MNTEFQKIFLFLGRSILKGIPQKAQRNSEYFCELSRCTLKKVKLPESQFEFPFHRILLALPEKNRL